jgi:hypothetical protein
VPAVGNKFKQSRCVVLVSLARASHWAAARRLKRPSVSDSAEMASNAYSKLTAFDFSKRVEIPDDSEDDWRFLTPSEPGLIKST